MGFLVNGAHWNEHLPHILTVPAGAGAGIDERRARIPVTCYPVRSPGGKALQFCIPVLFDSPLPDDDRFQKEGGTGWSGRSSKIARRGLRHERCCTRSAGSEPACPPGMPRISSR